MLLGDRIIVNSVAEFYEKAGKILLDSGNITSPRGLETKELIAPQIVIQNPRERLVYNDNRNYNIFHALTESILLFSPTDKVEHIARFNKNMKNFSDDGETMYGSYGKRISHFIDHIINKLKVDKDSRQAVLSIHKSVDLIMGTKDVPCTENLQFLIRENKLYMIVTMRSNDILFGFQYDVFMFSMLQETIANTLGIDIGYYIHNPASLHVYKDYPSFNGYEMLESMTKDSHSIKVKNDGEVSHWKKLASKVTDNETYAINGSTTINEIQLTLAIEELYKSIKDHRDEYSDRTKGYFHKLVKESPRWVKPFTSKWDKF
jgi:hypothetical protein